MRLVHVIFLFNLAKRLNGEILNFQQGSSNQESSANHLPLSGLFKQSHNYQCLKNGDSRNCKHEESKLYNDKKKTTKRIFGPRNQKVHLTLHKHQHGVGYTEEIEFNDRKMRLKVLSGRPLIFEVTNFLSSNETELIIDLSKEKGMKKQVARPAFVYLPDEITESTFDKWDVDFNGHLSFSEFYVIPEFNPALLSMEDLKECIKDSNLDADNNEFISYGELANGGLLAFKRILLEREMERQEERVRNTEQTWLWHDEDELLAYEGLLEDYHQRFANVTGIPSQLIEQSEPMQVQHYSEEAFSHCQYDSSNTNDLLPCCVYGKINCRVCRFMSIMLFLNDVESGGEVVFPFADNSTFSWSDVKEDTMFKCERFPNSSNCNVVVKPNKGSALFFYNHEVSPYTGWMGQMDPQSSVGITRVEKGELWMGTMWLDIIGDGVQELRPWRVGANWLSGNNLHRDIIEKMRNDYFREGEAYLHYPKISYRRDYDDDDGGDTSVSDDITFHTDDADKVEPLVDEPIPPLTNVTANETEVVEDGIERGSVENTTFESADCENDGVNSTDPNERDADSSPNITEPLKPDSLPGLERLKIKQSKQSEVPLGPPKKILGLDGLPGNGGKVIENRLVKASLLLIEELERDELEIIARTIHDKLQLACIPLIVNPIG